MDQKILTWKKGVTFIGKNTLPSSGVLSGVSALAAILATSCSKRSKENDGWFSLPNTSVPSLEQPFLSFRCDWLHSAVELLKIWLWFLSTAVPTMLWEEQPPSLSTSVSLIDSSRLLPSASSSLSPALTVTFVPLCSLSFDFHVLECRHLMRFRNSFSVTIRGRLGVPGFLSPGITSLLSSASTVPVLSLLLVFFSGITSTLLLSRFRILLLFFVFSPASSSFGKLLSICCSFSSPMAGGRSSGFAFLGLPRFRFKPETPCLSEISVPRATGFKTEEFSWHVLLGVSWVFFKKPLVLIQVWPVMRFLAALVFAAQLSGIIEVSSFWLTNLFAMLEELVAISLSFASTLLLDKLTEQTLRLIWLFARSLTCLCACRETAAPCGCIVRFLLLLLLGTAASPLGSPCLYFFFLRSDFSSGPVLWAADLVSCSSTSFTAKDSALGLLCSGLNSWRVCHGFELQLWFVVFGEHTLLYSLWAMAQRGNWSDPEFSASQGGQCRDGCGWVLSLWVIQLLRNGWCFAPEANGPNGERHRGSRNSSMQGKEEGGEAWATFPLVRGKNSKMFWPSCEEGTWRGG